MVLEFVDLLIGRVEYLNTLEYFAVFDRAKKNRKSTSLFYFFGDVARVLGYAHN